jgi:hypothetical protein
MRLSRRYVLLAPVLSLPTTAMADSLYRREPKLRHRGISNEGTVELAPGALVAVFGQPTDESWDSESVGGFYFVSTDDLPFTVYFRAYDRSAGEIAKLRKTFWSQTSPVEFSIGALGQNGLTHFKQWLQSQVSR